MSENTPILEFDGVSFSYAPGGVPALEQVSLKLERGVSGCIVGPNGGGKSTFLKLILGMLKPDAGTVRVFGLPPHKAGRRIGYMPQYHQLDAAFPVTVLEVVLMGRLRPLLLGPYSRHDREIARASLEEMGIADLAGRSFAALSGGQRQRVLIARALACCPELLLLDEPTANIDPGAEEQFYATLERLRKRMTVLTVSHDLGFVDREEEVILCVNRFVSIHHADDFDAAAANSIYHHQVKLIHHDHSCFCHCRGEERHVCGGKK